jgi:hypothetical protein
VALAAAGGNAATPLLIAVVLVAVDGIGAVGVAALLVVAIVCAGFAVAQARIVRDHRDELPTGGSAGAR